MKRISPTELEEPPQKRLKTDPPPMLDPQLYAKIFGALFSILINGDSKFLTEGTFAPDDLPISRAFRLLNPPTGRWQEGFFSKRTFHFSVDNQPVFVADSSYSDPKLCVTSLMNLMQSGDEKDMERISFLHNLDDYPEIQRLKNMAPKGMDFIMELNALYTLEPGSQIEVAPHAPHHHATLVVDFSHDEVTGGELLLDVDEQQHAFPPGPPKTGEEEYDINTSRSYPSVCFLSGLPFGFKPVTSGVRVFVQFDVLMVPKITDFDDFKELAKGTLMEVIPNDLIIPIQGYYITKSRGQHQEEGIQLQDIRRGNKCQLERPSRPVLTHGSSKDVKIDTDVLPRLVERFQTQHPQTSICFLMTQKYSITPNVETLEGVDRVLYDVLSPHYELILACATTREKSLAVMTYQDFKAFEEFVSDPNSPEKDIRWENDGRFDAPPLTTKMNRRVEGLQKELAHESNPLCVVFRGNGSSFMTYSSSYEGHYRRGEYSFGTVALAVGPRKTKNV